MNKSEQFVAFLEALKTPETNTQINGVIAGFKLLENEGALDTDVMGQSIVRIPITYTTRTEESDEIGEVDDSGYKDEEGDEVVVNIEEGETIPQAVAKYLQDNYANNDSEAGATRYWSTEPDIDYVNGGDKTKTLTYHMDALSPEDRAEVYSIMKGKKQTQGMPEDVEGDIQPTEEVNTDTLDNFVLAYIASALWTDEEQLQAEGVKNPSINNFAPESIKSIVNDCENFRELAGELLDEWTPKQAGHDFWLTRNGHGAGFWDRDDRGNADKETRDKLTEISKTFGGSDIYVGDDGKIYLS